MQRTREHISSYIYLLKLSPFVSFLFYLSFQTKNHEDLKGNIQLFCGNFQFSSRNFTKKNIPTSKWIEEPPVESFLEIFVTQKDENKFRPQGAERVGVLGILFFSCFFSEFLSLFQVFYVNFFTHIWSFSATHTSFCRGLMYIRL